MQKKFLGIFGSIRDNITMDGYSNAYPSQKALEESTEELRLHISEEAQEKN